MWWWQNNIKRCKSHVDPFPTTQNTLCSKLTTQVENKEKPYPFQTRQPTSFSLFHNHRQAPERIHKSKLQEKKRVIFLIPLLSRRCFSCFYNYHFLIYKTGFLLSRKEKCQPNKKFWTRKSFFKHSFGKQRKIKIASPATMTIMLFAHSFEFFLCAFFLNSCNPSMQLFSESSTEVTHRLWSWLTKFHIRPQPCYVAELFPILLQASVLSCSK